MHNRNEKPREASSFTQETTLTQRNALTPQQEKELIRRFNIIIRDGLFSDCVILFSYLQNLYLQESVETGLACDAQHLEGFKALNSLFRLK